MTALQVTVNIVLKTSDRTLSYIRNDVVRWTREESLASIESVLFADLPLRHQVRRTAAVTAWHLLR